MKTIAQDILAKETIKSKNKNKENKKVPANFNDSENQ